MNKCEYCGAKTKNPKYCCRSHAAKVNNLTPKRKKKIGCCVSCSSEISHKRKFCDNCSPNIVDWSTVTLADIHAKRSYGRNSRVRALARAFWIRQCFPLVCAICGYDRHVDIAHIVAISSFPLDTPVSVVNSVENLVALCKNHHWEHDNGLLALPNYY